MHDLFGEDINFNIVCGTIALLYEAHVLKLLRYGRVVALARDYVVLNIARPVYLASIRHFISEFIPEPEQSLKKFRDRTGIVSPPGSQPATLLELTLNPISLVVWPIFSRIGL